MDKHAWWKWLVLVGLVCFSVWVVTPPKEKIRLGLDLRGGTSFAVKIDQDRIREEIKARTPNITDEELAAEVRKTIEGAQGRALEVIRNRVDNLGIAEPVIYPGKDDRIIIQLPGIDEVKRLEAERSLQSLAFLEFRMVHEKNAELVRVLFDKNQAPDGYRIAVIGSESYYKRDTSVPDSALGPAQRELMSRFHTPSTEYEFMLEKDNVENQVVYRPHFVKRRRELSGDYLKDAAVDYRTLGQPVVTLRFDARGARMFANVTADYAPNGAKNPSPDKYRQLAIVLDGTLYSAPVIREAIYGGRAEISGSFTLADANFLSNILRAGSLPAPVKIVERRYVSPSLGTDSIRSGVLATALGGIGVLVFMGIYYLASGIIANIALLLNLILLPLGMILTAGLMGIFAKDAAGGGPIQLPVLTLPGIAGILLSIGMAVDANVLIFERIREEVKQGKRMWNAISAGYDRAFLAILDSNLTTVLTGVIMFIFGSGPIRGFAVTLCAGLIVSMYTALVITKMMFAVVSRRDNPRLLNMLSFIKETSIDFVAKRKVAAIFSLVVIVLSWIVMVARGVREPGSVLGVDFTGGTALTFSFDREHKLGLDTIRATLAEAGLNDASIQYQNEMDQTGAGMLQVKTGAMLVNGQEPAQVVKAALQAKHPEAAFAVTQEDDVGPQIGKELKTRAVWSLVLALVGMIIYLSWRFEFGFALGASVALFHDVLVTVGLYTLFGRQLNLTIVAALLTIIGFSVNDTIVIFDRIREDLRLVQNKTFKEICNLSINQTLSRTLLTFVTVMITVVMLLLVGGGAINDFALAMFIGVVAGVYSTVFIATPVVLLWHRDRRPSLRTQNR